MRSWKDHICVVQPCPICHDGKDLEERAERAEGRLAEATAQLAALVGLVCELCALGEPIVGTVDGKEMHSYYCGGGYSGGKSCRHGNQPCKAQAIKAKLPQAAEELRANYDTIRNSEQGLYTMLNQIEDLVDPHHTQDAALPAVQALVAENAALKFKLEKAIEQDYCTLCAATLNKGGI